MSRTGGGPGTNQHGIRGFGKTTSGVTKNSAPEVLLEFDAQTVVEAGDLEWGNVNDYDLTRFEPSEPSRAIDRLRNRRVNLIFNDAKLEGNNYTEPQVQTLLTGPDIDDADDFDARQILALSEGTDLVIQRVLNGSFTLIRETSNDVHRSVAVEEALDYGHFRGEGSVHGGGGTVDAMGLEFHGPPAGEKGENLRRIYADGIERIATIDHPALRAVTYAAFAAYNQFYFDGNKRTSRLMMNGELMAHGFDAIVTPATRQLDYNRSLRHMFEFGDAKSYIAFTLSCFDPN